MAPTTLPDKPIPLQKEHHRADFDCGDSELNRYLRDFGWENHQAGNARIFVTTMENRVMGYYALSTAGVDKSEVPQELKKGSTPSQIPCLLLARLAVDKSMSGLGIGRGLVVDAIRRTVHVAEQVGVRVLLIHANGEPARGFYLSLADFAQSPSDPLHLMLTVKQAREHM